MTDNVLSDQHSPKGALPEPRELRAVTAGQMPNEQTPIDVFCSYSHADEALWGELEKHLEVLRHTGTIQIWSDRRIDAGDEWSGVIDSHLESAQIILLLISADFLASKFCMEVEVKRAMERHNRGEAYLTPVILRPVDWLGHPLSRFQALPRHAKPITEWQNRDEALRAVAIGLREVIERVRKSRQSTEPQTASGPAFTQAKSRNYPFWWVVFALLAISVTLYWFQGTWYSLSRGKQVQAPLVHQNSVDHLSYVRIPPGSFVRGCTHRQPACSADAQPASVIQGQAYFWMGQTPVTILAYKNFLNSTTPGANPTPLVYELGLGHPVVNISWHDANGYCQWAGGRLPFEFEWEYAAGGGGGGESVGWFHNDAGSGARRVATVPPNGWSLYDTLGPVWEWCLDWYDTNYYARSPNVNPLGPDTGSQRVIRGGSWREDAGTIFPYTRKSLAPETKADNVGFRCVIDNPLPTF